jgi:CheY-like chemotaxis protein
MKRILLIEDDNYLCLLLERILSKTYRVTVTHDAVEAFCTLSEEDRPDLIITDIKMPHLDGLEFIENMKDAGILKEVPVIILSGYSDSEYRARCLALGTEAFLPKPFEPKILTEIIKNVFASRKAKLYEE